MPRRKTKEGAVETRKKRAATRRSQTTYDLRPIIDYVAKQAYELLSLDMYGFSADDVKDVIAEMVYAIAEGRSSKLTEEAALKKIMASKDSLLKALAIRLLYRGIRLSREQLEFIVSYAPEQAGAAAPYLYGEAKRLGATDIIDTLRSLWSRYGRPTPIECPRCGFRAVTPDLTCMICGAELTEKEVKEHIDFKRILVEAAKKLHPRLVEEIIAAGYVVVDDDIHPPSMAPRQGFSLTLHLSRDEKETLRSLLQGGREAPKSPP